MARTTIAPTTVPTGNPLTLQTVTAAAADVANGNQFQHTGREIVHVVNTGAATYTVTVQSVAINGRQDPLHNLAQNVTAGQIVVLNFRGEGWKQSADGMVYINASNVAVTFVVYRLPA